MKRTLPVILILVSAITAIIILVYAITEEIFSRKQTDPDTCVFIDGTLHNNGSKWLDGCDYTCECVDPAMNFYNCTARCKVFSSLPSICTLKPDPADACCEQPDCGTYSPIIGNTITGTPPPNKLNIIPIGTHTVFSGSSQNSTQNSGIRDACIYKGNVYEQGQSWDDGCDYTCTCEKGLYTCLSKCPAYPELPQYCWRKWCRSWRGTRIVHIVQIVPNVIPQNITGGYFPGGGYPINNSQISSVRTQCVYKNKVYNQGESWEVDCDFTCSCVDGFTGYYECFPKCPQYYNLPKECFKQQEKGKCCKSVLCVTPEGKFVKPDKQFPVVGTFHGGFNGFRPGLNYTTGPRNGCIYKGTHYDVGNEWNDGCNFHCKCVDEVTGRYDCNAICPTYTKLPALCHLKDIQGSCCKRLECAKPTTLAPYMSTPTPFVPTPDPNPGCTDVLDNCAVYGPSACKAPYDGWARRNCQHYCGMCAPVGVTTPTPLCEDKLKNCDQFGKQSCVNEFVPWAKENCQSYCQLCPSQLTGQTMPPCVDQDPGLCDALGADICIIDPISAKEHCQALCGLCPTPTGPSYQATTPAPNGYLLLMKGVTGIQTYPPGVTDLFRLWNSTHTINQFQPGANSLTPNFPGHYKPDLSNHWPDLCLDKVRVSIYKNGAEKAFMLFNATGADKMSWFSPNRIIDSSWIDLKSAQTQYFNMANHVSCPVYDHLPSSCKVCKTAGHCCGHVVCGWGCGGFHPEITTPLNTCFYKGQYYRQNDTWIDDCRYRCTCEKAALGFFRCRELCVNWILPPYCALKDPKPGKCCKTPICPPWIIIQYPEGYKEE